MTEPLPRWAMIRYAALWQKYGKETFSHELAAKTLGTSTNVTSVTLNRLKKDGWLTAQLHPEDSRKRIYTLTSPTEAVKGL